MLHLLTEQRIVEILAMKSDVEFNGALLYCQLMGGICKLPSYPSRLTTTNLLRVLCSQWRTVMNTSVTRAEGNKRQLFYNLRLHLRIHRDYYSVIIQLQTMFYLPMSSLLIVTSCEHGGRYQRFGERYCFHLQGQTPTIPSSITTRKTNIGMFTDARSSNRKKILLVFVQVCFREFFL